MLEVRDLRVSYGSTRAVVGVDLDARAGEAVALLGPNAAGKTSILRSLSGLVPYQGSVIFDGQDISHAKPREIVRAGLIHVPEGRHVFARLSVHENLEMGKVAAAGRAGSYSLDDVYSLFPALVELRRRLGYALSGGEQQMVAVGRALLAAPRLLLLDEPSLGLAPVVATAVFDALAEVARSTPLLVVEQNTAHALRLCSRAYVLSSGSVRFAGDTADLSDRGALLASFLGQRDVGASHQPVERAASTSGSPKENV